MKIVVLIIFVQIFAAVFTPCGDIVPTGLIAADTVAASSDVSQPSDGGECDDECSPYCICACRQIPAVSVMIREPLIEAATVPVSRTGIFEHRKTAYTTFLKPVWQPPRA
jgi:hypothetical protein